MTVDDFSIYGISASIIISIVSAGIALFAVYFTFKQAKISHNQFELELKKIEKPRVVENIQTSLNTLQQELDIELNAINKDNLVWVFPNERNNYYMSPLIFPLSQLKFFYDNFLSIFQGPDIQRHPEISTLIKSIAVNLKKRHEIYQNIDLNVQQLINEIEQSHFNERIGNLFSKISHFSILPQLQECGKSDILLHDLNTNSDYTKDLVDMFVKSMMISTLFKPLTKDDSRISCLGFSVITSEIYDKIPEFLKNDPIPHSEEIKNSIENLLDSLKTLDENILEDIGRIKKIYREIYTLKESEINQPQGFI
jgi:hypothetical protein